MNFSKNRIKTLLKKKNKVQSRKRYKKKHKKYLKNKKNSFRRKNMNIRKKSLKLIKIKRIAKKKRKAYIKQTGGFKKINWYEIKKDDVDNIQKGLLSETDVEEDYDAYSFDFLLEPFFSSRESLMKEFKNIASGLPPGAGFSNDDEEPRETDGAHHDETMGSHKNNIGHENTGEMERNTNKYLKNIDKCTPETIIHVGDGSVGNNRSFLFKNNPNDCNPTDSIESLWKNLFDMGI
tara:strand:- start:473 stop:1177 length:705 start_codon:yes stop_codon:yes gene_type:complete